MWPLVNASSAAAWHHIACQSYLPTAARGGSHLAALLRRAVWCRYIQLPVSAGMPEAWSKPWQELVQDGVRTRVTLMKAAEKVGLGRPLVVTRAAAGCWRTSQCRLTCAAVLECVCDVAAKPPLLDP